MWRIVDTSDIHDVNTARRNYDAGTHDCMWFRDNTGVLRWHIRKRKQRINRRPFFVKLERNEAGDTVMVPMY